MIIEAAPRLRDGTLGTFSPSSIKHRGKTHFSDGQRENKSYNRLSDFSEHCEKKLFYDREKIRRDLLDCDRTAHHAKNRRASHRGHPYDREGRPKRSTDKLDSILSALSYHKRPTWVRTFHRQKVVEIIQKLSPNKKNKLEKRKSKLNILPAPIFTANANENNDNCPGTTDSPSGFAITNQQTSSPVADEICDVEIHDLTEPGIQTRQDTNVCKKSRRSFNTNPLSASSFRSDKPPQLLCLDDLFSEDLYPKNECDPSQNFRPKPERRFSNFAESQSHFSNRYSSVTSSEGSESPSPSIENLVEFFESNSTRILSRKDPKKQNAQRTQAASHSSQHIQWRPNDFLNTDQHRNPFINQELKRPSFSSRCSANSQKPRDIPSDFSHFLPEVWNSVIRISSGHIPHGVISITGGIYNNNGNATSAIPDSSLVWPGNKYQKIPPIGRIDNLQPRISPSPSPTIFSKGCDRSSPTTGRYSPDIDWEDIKSTRVLNWSGTGPVKSPFDSRKQGDPLQLDNLIDLQTTSTRSRNWRLRKVHNLLADNAHIKSTYNQSLGKAGEQGGERFQSSQHQLARNDSEAVCLSASNHHNAPCFSSEERSCNERIHEKHFPFEDLQFYRTLLDPFIEERLVFSNSDLTEMGCIQSINKAKVSPDRCHHSVIVEDIQAAIDRTPTEIEEKSPIVLRYRTPYFRASAHVIVPPIPRKETWTVGWIQACDSMKFINQYGTLGSSSWEIPALKNRRITAVSDSDGVSYPWYGNTTEIATVEGPTETSRSLTLRMNDNFYPSVTWDVPVSEGSEAHLTHIVRDQSFTTWLAAVNQTTGRLEVLRTVKWHFYLEIEVDPKQKLGKRAMIVSPLVQKQPIILKNSSEPIYISSPNRGGNNSLANRQKRMNRRPGAGGYNNSNNHTNFIPKSALVRPSANNAQTLIWRPARDVPVGVVPAKEEYRENNEVVWFTRTPAMHGHDHNVRVLSHQEMSQLKQSIS